MDYLDSEEDYVPWAAAETQLGDLRLRLGPTEHYGAIQVSHV